jgi:ABC-type transport system involved in multi-copper enzyme maturation permease subunit
LFAPPRRESLMVDGTNPVYDKEIHGEIFSQGTLMLRLVIQISMLLAIPLMGVLLFWQTAHCQWFAVYVIVFNMLVGPVFLAGSMTSERERQTLDLLLTTTLSPWKIFWGKFVVGFRIALVLTSFLVWPMLLGVLLNPDFYSNVWLIAGLFAIPAVVCVINALVAMTATLFHRRTVMALMSTYVALLTLYVLPPALSSLASFVDAGSESLSWINMLGVFSPLSALFELPMDANVLRLSEDVGGSPGQPKVVWGYFACSAMLIAFMVGLIARRLKVLGGRGE